MAVLKSRKKLNNKSNWSKIFANKQKFSFNINSNKYFFFLSFKKKEYLIPKIDEMGILKKNPNLKIFINFFL